MRWVVTGGTGFIGRHLVEMLMGHDADASIRVVDLCQVAGLEALPDDFDEVDANGAHWDGAGQLIRCDVRDRALARHLTEGAERVVHLAASPGVQQSIADPLHDFDVNAGGALAYLDGARRAGAGLFVFASSGAVIGAQPPPLTESLLPAPVAPYGAGKRAAELYGETYSRAYGLRAVSLRFSNVYGPRSGHKGSAVAAFIRSALDSGLVTINGDGAQTRDFIHVRDVCRAILAAAATPAAQGVYHISTGQETSVRDLVSAIQAALARAGAAPFEVRQGPPLAGDVARNFASPERARSELGWSPRERLDTGLDETAAWFLAQPGRQR